MFRLSVLCALLLLLAAAPGATFAQPSKSAAEKAEAAEKARHDAQAAALVQWRRDQALLQTYTSEKDIESVRQRAIGENQKASQQVEKRIAALRQRLEKLAKQPGKSPQQLEQDRRALDYDLTLQEQLLESRRQEAVAINAKYDEEKRKYHALTKGVQK